MLLSGAIRTGSQIRPQAFGAYFRRENGALASCANGAAFEAVSGAPENDGAKIYKTLSNTFPVWDSLSVYPPCGQHVRQLLRDAIMHMNDEHNWTREQIADWVAEVEKLPTEDF